MRIRFTHRHHCNGNGIGEFDFIFFAAFLLRRHILLRRCGQNRCAWRILSVSWLGRWWRRSWRLIHRYGVFFQLITFWRMEWWRNIARHEWMMDNWRRIRRYAEHTLRFDQWQGFWMIHVRWLQVRRMHHIRTEWIIVDVSRIGHRWHTVMMQIENRRRIRQWNAERLVGHIPIEWLWSCHWLRCVVVMRLQRLCRWHRKSWQRSWHFFNGLRLVFQLNRFDRIHIVHIIGGETVWRHHFGLSMIHRWSIS